jgi:hypothetical protein
MPAQGQSERQRNQTAGQLQQSHTAAENSDPATRNPSLLLSGAELNKGSITVQIDTP